MDAPGVGDAELGERVRSGDEAAFALLYERYVEGVYDFLARLVRQPAVAEDLTQTTFVRAYEHRTALRDPARVKSWLFSTAHNLAMNHLKQTRPADPVEERWDLAAPGRGPEGEALARDAAELVWDAAASLEPRQYAVLDMAVRQDLTTPEIAGVLDLPVEHAAVLVSRAKEALGNAVRYLLVARRRAHCERLAALVPAGIKALSPEQRSTVDYHMRHCEDCRRTARLLTAPEELFGGLIPLTLPATLRQPPPAIRGGLPAPRPRPRRPLSHAISGHPRLALGGAVVAAAAVAAATGVASHHPGPTASSASTSTSVVPGYASPQDAVDGFYQGELQGNWTAVCSYVSPDTQALCAAGTSGQGASTGTMSVDGAMINGSEALVEVTGNLCDPSGSCASNSDPSSGMPPSIAQFAAIYSSIVSSSLSSSVVTISPMPCIEVGGKWYVALGG